MVKGNIIYPKILRVYLTEEQNKKIEKNARLALMKKSQYVRLILDGIEPSPVPDEDYFLCLQQLRIISNNMNQIASKANSIGVVDSERFKEQTDEVKRLIYEMDKNTRLPEK